MELGEEQLKNVVRVLLLILKYEEKGTNPTLSDIVAEAPVNHSVLYYHLKRNLEKAGWVEFRVNPDRTITAHLTPKGRKLAEALKQAEDILKEAGVV